MSFCNKTGQASSYSFLLMRLSSPAMRWKCCQRLKQTLSQISRMRNSLMVTQSSECLSVAAATSLAIVNALIMAGLASNSSSTFSTYPMPRSTSAKDRYPFPLGSKSLNMRSRIFLCSSVFSVGSLDDHGASFLDFSMNSSAVVLTEYFFLSIGSSSEEP